jgi:hypothetical protein
VLAACVGAVVGAALVAGAAWVAAPVVAAGADPLAAVGCAAAVVGADVVPVVPVVAAGFGVSVAVLPPHAARRAPSTPDAPAAAIPRNTNRRFTRVNAIPSSSVPAASSQIVIRETPLFYLTTGR